MAYLLQARTGLDVHPPRGTAERFATMTDLVGVPGWSFRIATNRRLTIDDDLDLAEQGRRDDGVPYAAVIQWGVDRPVGESYAALSLATFARLLRARAGYSEDPEPAPECGTKILSAELRTRIRGESFRRLALEYFSAMLPTLDLRTIGHLDDVDPSFSLVSYAASSLYSWSTAFEAAQIAAESDGRDIGAVIFNRREHAVRDAIVGMTLESVADLIATEVRR